MIPNDYRPVIEKYSKAFLMDMVWAYATRDAGSGNPHTIYSAFLREEEAIRCARQDRPAAPHAGRRQTSRRWQPRPG